jgi:hypothetical protein
MLNAKRRPHEYLTVKEVELLMTSARGVPSENLIHLDSHREAESQHD